MRAQCRKAHLHESAEAQSKATHKPHRYLEQTTTLQKNDMFFANDSFAKQNVSETNDIFAKQTTAAMFKLQSAVQDTERHFNFASYFAESA